MSFLLHLQMSLQGGLDGGSNSPGSQYPKWLGSPNSHSNDDFEPWGNFRTRASSDASTLSGRRSPFLPEEDEAAEVHIGYPGTKLGGPLPSLSEVAGHHGSENMMDNLLDNLNLISPKNNAQGSQEAQPALSSPMMQGSPGYPSYNSPNIVPQPQVQQDYRKCLYGQGGVGGLNPIAIPTLSDSKPGGYGPFVGQYNCAPGLLKELLTADADPRGELMQSGEGQPVLPSYASQGQMGQGGKMIAHPHLHAHQRSLHQLPSPAMGMNGCAMLPHGHPVRLSLMKPQPHLPHHTHLGRGGGEAGMPSYTNGNGFHRHGAVAHHHHSHPERLPSDLDDMLIDQLDVECDVERVLHDTLMDGDALDFNFDPMSSQQSFTHSVKTSTHNWVSG